jgi:Short C-terminal domain/Phospholipase_D-nuclease N-terminal
VGPILLNDITFWDIIWYMIILFAWMLVFWMFISVFSDIFRRRDINGWLKAFWIIMICALPLLGILIYMIARPVDATREQDMEMIAAQRRAMGVTAADEIAKANELLKSGAITQAEFDQMKSRALM